MLYQIFFKSPALQISEKDGDVTEQTLSTIEATLNKQHILYKKAELSDNKGNISVIFADVEEQLKAKKALKQDLGNDFVIAMNMLSNSPAWMSSLGANPMNLGLDLRGGMYLMLEADTKSAIDAQLDNTLGVIVSAVKENGVNIESSTKSEDKANVSAPQKYKDAGFVSISLASQADTQKVTGYLNGDFKKTQDANILYTVNGNTIFVSYTSAKMLQLEQGAISQVVTVMRNRINALGVAEASVAQAGTNRSYRNTRYARCHSS